MNAVTRVAVVTGGARRLGRHLALSLGARGWDVVVLFRTSSDDADATVAELRELGRHARALRVDIRSRQDVAAAFADVATREQRIDLLVNNVGNYNPQPVTALDPVVWDDTIAANLSGAYYCCYEALKAMPRGGAIINIGMAGLEGIRANTRGTDYYVSKTGLLVLTRALAKGYADRGIRVNMVSPGQLDNSVDLPRPEDMWRTVPLGRAGTLDDVAGAVHYLLGADYVTGVNIDVSGGYRL